MSSSTRSGTNKRTRRKLPVAYSVWRPFIEMDESSHNASPVSTALEPRLLTPDVIALAQRGDELYTIPEFETWMFEPLAAIQPYFTGYLTLRNSIELGQRSRKRRSGQKNQEQRTQEQKASLEALVSEVIVKVIDGKWRALYEARLRRQGVLFQFEGRAGDAALVGAVAGALEPNSPIPVQEQPFLRTMMHRSLEQGLFRLMAQAIEGGRLGSMPIDLFPEDNDFYS
jgi:hypothetical protein